MKKNKWIYIVIAVCLLAGAGYLLVNKTINRGSSVSKKQTVARPADKEKAKRPVTPKKPEVKVAAPRHEGAVGKTGKSKNADELIGNASRNFRNCSSKDEKIDMLDSLTLITDRRVLDVIGEAMKDPDKDVRLAAVTLLEDFTTNDAVPLLAKALEDKNEEIRLSAINSLDGIETPEAAKVLAKCLSDSSEEVRDAAFSSISSRGPEVKEPVAAEAVKSPFPDIKKRVPYLVIDIPSHSVMDILIEGLKDKDPECREEYNSVIRLFVSEEFESYDKAKKWWQENKHKYDRELNEK